eukprot:gene5670-6547_t
MNKLILLVSVILIALTATTFATGSLDSSAASSNETIPVLTGCAARLNCSECVQENSCVWCGSDAKCTDGTFYGSKPISTCKDYKWYQCKMQGRYTLLIAAGIIAAVLIIIITAICCCCCCRRKSVTKVYHIQDDETRGLLTSPTPVTDRRREEMKMKYGVGQQKSTSSWN